MEIENLLDLNPWWRNPLAIQMEPKIYEFDQSKVRWIPRIKACFDMGKDCVYTLRGPRQVGKTTLLKLIIRDLLLDKVNPRTIFYLTCDIINNERELADVIDKYIDFSQRQRSSERQYIFVDEISSVKNWERAIKYLADAGKLVDTTVILTGSHSLDIKYSTERLPGRRGEEKGPVNKILLPMKFSEYVETVRPDLKKEISNFYSLKKEKRFKIFFELFEGKIDSGPLTELRLFQKDFRTLLDNYLLTGGTIRAIKEYYGEDTISGPTYEIYVRSLIGDLARWKYQENIAKQVLRSAITRMTTRVSLNAIAKENEIGSHNTVSNYLSTLEDSFVLNIFYQMDLQKKLADYKRERKLYFIDPFIYHAIRGWVHGEVDYFGRSRNTLSNVNEKSKIMEMIVAGHLARYAYDLNPSDVFSHHECLFFWRQKHSDREVDFIMKRGDKLYPIETKYQNTVTRRDLSNLFSFKKGVIISKQTMETYRSYSIIPIELFLMLI